MGNSSMVMSSPSAHAWSVKEGTPSFVGHLNTSVLSAATALHSHKLLHIIKAVKVLIMIDSLFLKLPALK